MTPGPMGPREVARATGVSTDTLRHYERNGLLPASHETAAGYRRYSAAMVHRVLLILRALVVGFSLADLKKYSVYATRAARGQFVSGQLPHGRRNALLDTIGQRRRSLDWRRRGHSADWHQKWAVSTHWMRPARAVRSKALDCDRGCVHDGYQIRLCQPRASVLRRT